MKVETPSMLYDWVPTFTEMAGLPAPAVMDGVSLMPSLTGKGRQQQSNVYVEYNVGGRTPKYPDFAPQHRGRIRNQMQMVRYGKYVGVRYDVKSADDDFEIYDVESDPQQVKNLASSMPDMQKRMKAGVLQMRMPNTSAPRPYDNAFVPPVEAAVAVTGFAYKTYEGDFPWVPDVSSLKPVKSGRTEKVTADVQKKGSVVEFTGFVDIPEDGEYVFTVNATGKASLRIHKALVVDADFKYRSGTDASGRMKLKAGKHPVRLTYLKDKNEKSRITLNWKKL